MRRERCERDGGITSPRYYRVMTNHSRGYHAWGDSYVVETVEETDEEITLEEVCSSIAKLKSKKAPGVWGVTGEMLKAGGGVSRVQEEKLVSQALQGNSYPKGFIRKHTCPQLDQRTPRDQVARGAVTLPYISGLPESIRRVLAP